MTIVWLDLISELGGAQHSMLDVCTTLRAQGVEIMAAVPYGPLFDRLTAAGLTVFPVSPVRATTRGWGLFKTTAKLLRAPSAVSQIIRTVKPDIVHANSLAALLAVKRAHTAIPTVWHVRDLHLPILVARDAAKKASRIIAASEAIDEYLVGFLSPRILGNTRVIRNGIDPARFEAGDKAAARQRLNLPPNVPVIGMVAHLTPWKRHDAFIQIAAAIRAQNPDAHFVAAGRDLFKENTRWVAQLEQQVAQEGLSGCFHWIKDCDSIQEILPAFDLLIHPALNEPFGRVVCEAMAASIPVIAAESGGPMGIIEQGISGILVREGDPQRMAEEALALLANPSRAASIGEAGRKRVLKNFTTNAVCEQLAKEYRLLLNALSYSHDDD